MCVGIPMQPDPGLTAGCRVTFAQCLAHLGGVLVPEDAAERIRALAPDYIWCYPGRVGYCTACGRKMVGVRGIHGEKMPCPMCGQEVTFRHERKGHQRVYDEFYYYQWRRSATDPEAILLVAIYCGRNSSGPRPEFEAVQIRATKVYLFRPGKAVTVYQRWYSRFTNNEHWERTAHINPAHTGGGAPVEYHVDYDSFRQAIEGTRIGRVYGALLREQPRSYDLIELTAIASCARRPYLEYLAKCGQATLAAELMRMQTVSRDIVPNPRGKNPRALLGLTDSQWHEIRSDPITLTAERLERLAYMKRMGLSGHVWETLRESEQTSLYSLSQLAPPAPYEKRRGWTTVGELLRGLNISEKTRRRAYRTIIRSGITASEWRDYYEQIRRMGGDLTDTALLMPRDMREKHQEMIEREEAIRKERKQKEMATMNAQFRKRLEKLQRRFVFQAAGLVLRPYESAMEVEAEGTALHICIGRYAEHYLRGDTVICCLRRAEEPDVPWRAVEFSRDGRVVQDRGMYNDMRGGISPGTKKQLRAFWHEWDRAKRVSV